MINPPRSLTGWCAVAFLIGFSWEMGGYVASRLDDVLAHGAAAAATWTLEYLHPELKNKPRSKGTAVPYLIKTLEPPVHTMASMILTRNVDKDEHLRFLQSEDEVAFFLLDVGFDARDIAVGFDEVIELVREELGHE